MRNYVLLVYFTGIGGAEFYTPGNIDELIKALEYYEGREEEFAEEVERHGSFFLHLNEVPHPLTSDQMHDFNLAIGNDFFGMMDYLNVIKDYGEEQFEELDEVWNYLRKHNINRDEITQEVIKMIGIEESKKGKMDEYVYDAIVVSNYIEILDEYISEVKRAWKLSKTFVFEPGLFLYNEQDDSRFPNTPTRIVYEAYYNIPFNYVMIDKMFEMLNKKTSIIHNRLHIYHDENGNRLVPIDLELQYLQEEITDWLFIYLEFLEDVKDQFQIMEEENK